MTTTEAVVVEVPKDEKEGPAGMGGGGMGGMGGMDYFLGVGVLKANIKE